MSWRFAALVVATAALAAFVVGPRLDRYDGGATGLYAGLGFSVVSALAGFHWLRWSVGRSQHHFAAAVLGGMLVRLVAVGVFAVALSRLPAVHLAVALLTIVTAQLIFAGLEIVYLKRTGALG